jgi:hypothetical protein
MQPYLFEHVHFNLCCRASNVSVHSYRSVKCYSRLIIRCPLPVVGCQYNMYVQIPESLFFTLENISNRNENIRCFAICIEWRLSWSTCQYQCLMGGMSIKNLLCDLKGRFMLQPQASYSTVNYYPLQGKPELLAMDNWIGWVNSWKECLLRNCLTCEQSQRLFYQLKFLEDFFM